MLMTTVLAYVLTTYINLVHSMLIASHSKHNSLSCSKSRFEPGLGGNEAKVCNKIKYLGDQTDESTS